MQQLEVGRPLLFAMLLAFAGPTFADVFTFTNIDFPGATWTEAYGINNLGQLVGGYTDASGFHSFLYSNGAFTTLAGFATAINDRGEIVGDTLLGYLYPYGINDQGQIVGQAGCCTGFIDTNGTVTLPYPFAYSIINGINDSGEIVGKYHTILGIFYFVATGPPYGSPLRVAHLALLPPATTRSKVSLLGSMTLVRSWG
jgi:probable HAF family extracellular repeat protein